MKILVTGTRALTQKQGEKIQDTIRKWVVDNPSIEQTTLIEGGANGVDRYAGLVADYLDFIHIRHPALWDRFGKKAGIIRNCEMLDLYKPSHVLAFPGKTSRGTWHCVSEAKKKGIPVTVFEDAK